MDIESLKSLGWLLPWGAAFFAMMRFGCGAHRAGGRPALGLRTRRLEVPIGTRRAES